MVSVECRCPVTVCAKISAEEPDLLDQAAVAAPRTAHFIIAKYSTKPGHKFDKLSLRQRLKASTSAPTYGTTHVHAKEKYLAMCKTSAEP